MVVLTAPLPTAFARAAYAEPAAGSVTAEYGLVTGYDVVQADDPIFLVESGLHPADAEVTRRINWGDGSPIEVETTTSREHG